MSPRRKYLRLDWSGKIEWRHLPKTEAEEQSLGFTITKSHDIGLNGLSFLTDKPVNIGTRIELKIYSDGNSSPVHSLAEVTWVGTLRAPQGKSNFSVGTRFLNIPDDSVHRLLMDIYRCLDSAHSWECGRSVRCSPAQRSRCPAPKDGKNCWQYPLTPCCSRDRSLCPDCPISLATLLIQT